MLVRYWRTVSLCITSAAQNPFPYQTSAVLLLNTLSTRAFINARRRDSQRPGSVADRNQKVRLECLVADETKANRPDQTPPSPSDQPLSTGCFGYHKELSTLCKVHGHALTRFVHSLKKPFNVSAVCWHAFVAARPSTDFFTSSGRDARSSAHSFSNPCSLHLTSHRLPCSTPLSCRDPFPSSPSAPP